MTLVFHQRLEEANDSCFSSEARRRKENMRPPSTHVEMLQKVFNEKKLWTILLLFIKVK
jgi:hypothetical protein